MTADEAQEVPLEAKHLHERARAAGQRGDYAEALDLLTRAATVAPQWPYSVYDRAFTHLLRKNFAAALSDYRRTVALSPRGFFTALTAIDTLEREQSGEFPPGLYLAFVMLDQVNEPDVRRRVLGQMIEDYPEFAAGWQKYAQLQERAEERREAIERGLDAKPDRET